MTMKGPLQLLRSGKIEGMENLGPLYEWSEAPAYLVIEEVSFRGRKGAIFCYYNPPVHQVGNPALDAYLEGFDRVYDRRNDFHFLMMIGANDPVHAGGDLKESLEKLDRTTAMKKEKEEARASAEEIDALYDWADRRLGKGIVLHGKVRKLAQYVRMVAVCGGGTRFGGSAEIPLMCDYLIGDSRSGMCFSEAMIGLLPGWSGVARALIKAGPLNARYMAMKAAYAESLERHDGETGTALLPKALEIATCPEDEVPMVEEPVALAGEPEIDDEVKRRQDPQTYAHIWGKPLKEVSGEIGKLGRPLAPQSVRALSALLGSYSASGFDEFAFVKREADADARLYRDPKFRAGLTATLEQKVADFREVS
jgi:enoyl-CoA hydratase/carnithine racemase